MREFAKLFSRNHNCFRRCHTHRTRSEIENRDTQKESLTLEQIHRSSNGPNRVQDYDYTTRATLEQQSEKFSGGRRALTRRRVEKVAAVGGGACASRAGQNGSKFSSSGRRTPAIVSEWVVMTGSKEKRRKKNFLLGSEKKTALRQ